MKIDLKWNPLPFVIKELEPEQEPEKVLYYTGENMMDDRFETINGVEYKFYGQRSMERARQKAVNVGTVGHVDWGKQGYQPNMADISWSTPSITRTHYTNAWAGYGFHEMMGLWQYYLSKIEEGYTDVAAIKAVFGSRRKLNEPYLDFQDGGLIVAGRVIWILPDKQYTKFHKKAADWVLPSKEYVKALVANFLIQQEWQEKHNPVIARVQGVDVRKTDVANGWGAYAGKLMVAEYERNPDGSYKVDADGCKVPTGREVEGVRINTDEVFMLDKKE